MHLWNLKREGGVHVRSSRCSHVYIAAFSPV